MKRQQYEKIKKQIEINKNHIENFVLESTTGTKRMQDKFHKNAIIERNKFVNQELESFKNYKEEIYKELIDTKNSMITPNNQEEFNQERIKEETIKDLIFLTNKDASASMKLGLIKLLEPFENPDDSSLTLINNSLKEIIEKLKEASIILTSNDFDYSMFTSLYMDNFFKNQTNPEFDQLMQKNFESIYWECPDLVTHLKLNLYSIFNKYKKNLDERAEFIKNSLLKKEELTANNVYKAYSDKKLSLDYKINTDSYLNLNKFLNKKLIITDYLENSPAKEKNFKQFAKDNDYNALSEQDKISYTRETFNLYNSLKELKNYYLFEPIIKDLKTLYQKKEETKNLYSEKLKEITKEEQARVKIYKDYNKSLTKGLFSKPNPDKARLLKLQMNEQITKLNTLYNELHDTEINNFIAKLPEATTVFELLEVSLNSSYYLKKIMNSTFKDKDGFTLEKYLEKYFNYIYKPTNMFIKKINAFTEYDIADIVSEKYRLSGLNLTNEDISKDSLDLTTETVKYITTFNYIKQGNLSIKDMYFIYNVTQLEILANE